MARLPRIACFHGGGSNSEVFKVQCQLVQEILQSEFEFVYFDAPFFRSAGPGVLPAFENYAPFRTWFRTGQDGVELGDGSGYDEAGRDGIERVWKMMETGEQAGGWVAAMGFSQGSRVVGGLLLDQQRHAEAGSPRDTNLKFGVLCMGGGAPMLSEVSQRASRNNQDTKGPASVTNSDLDRISIPTLHLHGLKDIHLDFSRKQLAAYYDPSVTTLCEINYHHAMPWVKRDAVEFANLIRQVFMDTQVAD